MLLLAAVAAGELAEPGTFGGLLFDTRTIVQQSGVFSLKIPFLWAPSFTLQASDPTCVELGQLGIPCISPRPPTAVSYWLLPFNQKAVANRSTLERLS